MTEELPIYGALRACYLAADRRNLDKARSFRSLLEDFFRSVGMTVAPGVKGKSLTQAVYRYFSGCSSSKKAITALNKLIHELNACVHEERELSDEALLTMYQTLLRTLHSGTGIAPHLETLESAKLAGRQFLMGLNKEQHDAVLDNAKTVVVDAGPGTGKTFLLVRRMLVHLDKAPNAHVVALSFTNAAAVQLREKFTEASRQISPTAEVFFNTRTATIHSYCYHLLADYALQNGEVFTVEFIDPDDAADLADELAAREHLDSDEHASALRLFEEGMRVQALEHVRKLVVAFKRERHLIHVDEILDLFIKALEAEPFRAWLRGKLDLLLVDECQDLTSRIYEIIRALIELNPDAKLFFVGDPRQNIFAFNGGSYRNLLKFLKQQTEPVSHRTLRLTYRCPQVVIDRVNALNFTDCANAKLARADSSLIGETELIMAEDPVAEAAAVVERIARLEDPASAAVLCSWLSPLEAVATELNRAGIAWGLKGGRRTAARDIKRLMACLRYIEQRTADTHDRLRNRFADLDEQLVESLIEKLNLIADKHNAQPQKVADIIRAVAPFISIITEPDEASDLEAFAALAGEGTDIRAFLYEVNMGRADRFATFYVSNFAVQCTVPTTADKPQVTLSTIHSAKGLEWEHVYVISLFDGCLPSYLCEKETNVAKCEEMLNDECKKFYVACTRCKGELTLSLPLKTSTSWGMRRQVPSRFLSLD